MRWAIARPCRRCASCWRTTSCGWDESTGTPEQQLHYAAGLRRWDRWEQLARGLEHTVRAELSGGDRAAFQHACRVLAEDGGEAALQALVVALRELPFGLSPHPADALERLDWSPRDARDRAYLLVARLGPGDRPAPLLALGSDAFEVLAQALPHAPETIAVVLAALGDQRAVPLIAGEIHRADAETRTCRTLIEAIARLGGPQATPVLEQLGRKGRFEDNREAAMQCLRERTRAAP